MKQEFEFQPFDRVTVQINETIQPAVFFQNYSTFTDEGQKHFLEVAYVDPYGQIRERRVMENAILHGHYDADGNWLPQPGEPCYMINKGLRPIPYIITSVDGKYIEAIDLSDYEPVLEKYVIVDSAAVALEWEGSKMVYPPETAFLYPGRIKTAKQ